MQEKHTDTDLRERFRDILQSKAEALMAKCVRRITFVVAKPGSYPLYYTFRATLGYNEDEIHRHIEPPLAFQLDIRRLSNFNITRVSTEHRHLHVYFAREKRGKGRSFFMRTIVRAKEMFQSVPMRTVRANTRERGETGETGGQETEQLFVALAILIWIDLACFRLRD